MEIKVKTFRDQVMPDIINKGEWIDLRANLDHPINLYKGDLMMIPLGIGMILPKGFEALVAPRSSTPKKFGILSANSIGIIDNSYSGDNDEWKFVAYALRKTTINPGDRICQFRIQLSQKATIKDKLRWLLSNKITLKQVNRLNSVDRNGFGSTGIC